MANIGTNIRLRRLQLGMSQEELAKKAGYSSRSTINKIEKDGRNLPSSKIMDIAKALHTTPGYIMGWRDLDGNPLPEDCESFEPHSKEYYQDAMRSIDDSMRRLKETATLIQQLYNQLDTDDQDEILNIIRYKLQKKKDSGMKEIRYA